MGAYSYIQQSFEKGYGTRSDVYKARLFQFRREPTVTPIDKPTNPARARALGYKAKQGFVVARVRVRRGSGVKTRFKRGRKPRAMGVNKITRGKSKQTIAEERAQRRYPNLETLNSYWIADDGVHKWFEVIMLDPHHPVIRNDPNVSWITSNKHTNRANRGKTSSARRGRGLHNKGKGAEKIRPSLNANKGRGK